jgi:hypothetical protein
MDEALPKQEYQTLMAQVHGVTSAAELFKISAKIAREMYDAERAVMDAFHSAAVLAPEFKELENKREKRRYERQRETLEWAFQTNQLAPTLSLERARDILWACTGRDFYRLFVVEQQWPSAEYEQWLAELLIKMLTG